MVSSTPKTRVGPDLAPFTDALGACCRPPSPDELASLAAQGLHPRVVCAPRTVEEISTALRVASAAGLPVIPAGGRTQLGLGAPPRGSDVLLDLRSLSAVLEYTPEDLTASVQAGVRLADLEILLGERGQFLALNPALPEDATLGGILATNAWGSWRARFGAMRDLLIGSRIVHGDGMVSRSGGKVVKNVAGYDLNKAWVGSLGTLGVLVEATFKLHPSPAVREWSEARFVSRRAATHAAHRLARSPLPYLGVELANPPAAQALGLGADYVLVVEWGGPLAALARCQSEWVELATAAGAGSAGPRAGPLGAVPWLPQAGDTVVRASLLLNQAAPFLAELASQWPGARAVAQPTMGTVTAAGPLEPGTGSATVRHLRAIASTLGGWLVVESAPLALQERVDVWGPPSGSMELMSRLKRAYDPAGVLNPGRYVGGL